MSESEKNLFDFYRRIGLSRYISLAEGKDFSAVSGASGCWPQMIFDIDLSESAGKQLVKNFIQAEKIVKARFAVCNSCFFTSEDQEYLRQNAVFPVESWTLMEINRNGNFVHRQSDKFSIRKLEQSNQIEAFTLLVNSELMKAVKVDSHLFPELLHSPGTDIYGLFMDNELLSGLLSFSDNNQNAGLYFIVTKSGYRGKGLATEIIGSAVYSLFQQGIKKVVLQAVPKAVSLYTRLGFSPQGKLIIFWKQ